jgi:hypothetical protein
MQCTAWAAVCGPRACGMGSTGAPSYSQRSEHLACHSVNSPLDRQAVRGLQLLTGRLRCASGRINRPAESWNQHTVLLVWNLNDPTVVLSRGEATASGDSRYLSKPLAESLHIMTLLSSKHGRPYAGCVDCSVQCTLVTVLNKYDPIGVQCSLNAHRPALPPTDTTANSGIVAHPQQALQAAATVSGYAVYWSLRCTCGCRVPSAQAATHELSGIP